VTNGAGDTGVSLQREERTGIRSAPSIGRTCYHLEWWAEHYLRTVSPVVNVNAASPLCRVTVVAVMSSTRNTGFELNS